LSTRLDAGRAAVDVLLEAQRFWLTARVAEQAALAEQAKARSAFEHARGNLPRYHGFSLVQGP
jgi:hypothetical protein